MCVCVYEIDVQRLIVSIQVNKKEKQYDQICKVLFTRLIIDISNRRKASLVWQASDDFAWL